MDPAMQQAPVDPGQPFDPSMAGPEPQMEGTPPVDPAAGQALQAVGSGQAPIGMPPKTASANRARNIATIMRRLRA